MAQVEFVSRFRPNGNKVKGLVIKGKSGMKMQDIINISKHEARIIGMGYVEILDVVRAPNCDGWLVAVQSVVDK